MTNNLNNDNTIEHPRSNPDVLAEDKRIWKERPNRKLLDKLFMFNYNRICGDQIDRYIVEFHFYGDKQLKWIGASFGVPMSSLVWRKKQLIKKLRRYLR